MATTRDPRVTRAPVYATERRQLRRPQHRFSLVYRPYQLQPFMIAPVLPAETLENMLCQARVISDPLDPAVRLVGWWSEFYWFYVKHRDLAEGTVRDTVSAMVLDPATDMSALQTGAAVPWSYAYDGAIDWVSLCTQRIVEEYFRDEGENWNTYLLDSVPQVAIFGKGSSDWSERLTLDANKRVDESGYDLMGGEATLQPRELIERMAHWQALREAGLTDMDYKDFVNTYGDQTREEETSPNLHRPELLRYVRHWQYPTNTVEPTTGVPTSAVHWSVAERADKNFRFNEPGFIIGLTCTRPKIYFGKQEGALAGAMQDVYSWLPAILQDNYEAAYQKFAQATGPLAATITADDYWIDMRDLYLGGDQFCNYAPTGLAGTVALPASTSQRRYAASADINAFFASDSVNKLLCDGVVHLAIKGQQRKTVPGTVI